MNNMPHRLSANSAPAGADPLGQFEERLLGELKTVIASQAIPEHPHSPRRGRSAQRGPEDAGRPSPR